MNSTDNKLKEMKRYLDDQAEMHSYINSKIHCTEYHKGAYDAFEKASIRFTELFDKEIL
jgi:hypothetical protein